MSQSTMTTPPVAPPSTPFANVPPDAPAPGKNINVSRLLFWSMGLLAVYRLCRDPTTPHNAEVLRIAQQLEARGWDVAADLPGWPMPTLIGGMRPDILAEQDGQHLVIEVETSRSVDRNHSIEQDQTFSSWAWRSKRRRYKQIVVEVDG